MNSRNVYLLKNISYLAIGQLATKILMFLLLPLYTSILDPQEYGTFDLCISTIALILPIFTVNITEAVLRFSVNSKKNEIIFTNGLKMIFLSHIICFVFIIINSYYCVFPLIQEHSIIFFIIYILSSLLELHINFARGINKMSFVAISGFIGSLTNIVLNIILLCCFHLKLLGFFESYIVSLCVQIIYLGCKFKINKYIVFKDMFSGELYNMLKYSFPLIWNSIAWWFNDISNRYIIAYFCGVYETGIYAAGTRIPAILAVIQSIFNKAWIVSAIKNFEDKDSDDFFSNTYKIYNSSMLISCSFLILCNKFLADILFDDKFYEAWKYSPLLLISLVFGALSGYLGGIFAAKKVTVMYSYSTILGACSNIIICIVFIPILGTIGASIASVISGILVWWFRIYKVKKFINLKINLKKDIENYSVLLLQAIVMLLTNGIKMYIALLLCFLFIVIQNKQILLIIIKTITNMWGKKK